MCGVGHDYAQANTNNVDNAWALLQTTGGKNEPNIVCMHLCYLIHVDTDCY